MEHENSYLKVFFFLRGGWAKREAELGVFLKKKNKEDFDKEKRNREGERNSQRFELFFGLEIDPLFRGPQALK